MYNAFNSYCPECGDYIPAGTYHSCSTHFSEGSYCKKCGLWIEPEVAHMCSELLDEIEILKYNYKCPDCGGEFNEPSTESSNGTSFYFNYKCPFCGREMKGLNQ